MLQITVPAREWWDEATGEFVTAKEQTLQLEHSLVSLSKWESRWKKPFLDKRTDKTVEETLDYFRCMTITQNVDPMVYYSILSDPHLFEQISKYIDDSMTATWFNRMEEGRRITNRETVTAELIYYWMIALNVPFECQKWHLNRLLTLIEVCNIKNTPAKKMSKRDIMSRNASLNAQRRKRTGSKG